MTRDFNAVRLVELYKLSVCNMQGTLSHPIIHYHNGKKVLLSYGLPPGASQEAHYEARQRAIVSYYKSQVNKHQNRNRANENYRS